MNEIKQYPRELSVDDIQKENRQFVRSKVKEIITEQFKPLDPSIEVVEIYIFGSFKNGNAKRIFSDLDIRVVLAGDINESEGELIKETIKNEVTGELPEERVFGYVDPKIFPPGHGTNTEGVVL